MPANKDIEAAAAVRYRRSSTYTGRWRYLSHPTPESVRVLEQAGYEVELLFTK